jgi:antitoxin component YwqK of YwqJK toxin-antitoxin module
LLKVLLILTVFFSFLRADYLNFIERNFFHNYKPKLFIPKTQYYSHNNKLRSKFYFSKTLQKHVLIQYSLLGQKKHVITFNDKKQLDGEVKQYNRLGMLRRVMPYKNGVLYGKGKLFDNGGRAFADVIFKNGMANGILNIYEDGKLKSSYILKDNLRNGEYKLYTKVGNVKLKGFYKDDEKHGFFTEYDSSGNMIGLVNFDNGMMHGVAKRFYSNGNIKSKEAFKYGKKYGKSIEYYENGKISKEVFFQNNLKHGVGKLYYKSGNLKAVTKFLNGKINGLEKTYYDNGALKRIGKFDKGLETGVFKEFYKNKKLKKKILFQNGKVKKFVEYAKDGSMVINGKIADKVEHTYLSKGEEILQRENIRTEHNDKKISNFVNKELEKYFKK